MFLNKHLTIEIMYGLCNQLFQLAFLEYLQTITRYPVHIININKSPHSSISYFDTIFQNWKSVLKNHTSYHTQIREHRLYPKDWKKEIESVMIGNVKIWGYFQNYKYVLPSFISRLNFDTNILHKYPNIQNTVFLHIRGGDYINNPLHHIDLLNYYKRAILEFEVNTQFSIFTNDKVYASNIVSQLNINHTSIDENEIDSLYLMSQCKGGICANSSFSWWGAYLNPNRKITMPSKWFNSSEFYTDGFYFPNVIKLEV